MLEIRKFESDDISNILELTNLFRRTSMTLEQQIEQDSESVKVGVSRERFTALVNGRVVGFSSLTKQMYMGEAGFFAQLAVKPEARGQGFGTKILDQLLGLARVQNAAKLRSEVSNLEPRDKQFVKRHNIRVLEQMVLSQLDLSHFDLGKFRDLEHKLTTDGIRFARLSNFQDTPETRENLYQLVRQSVEDDPGFEGEFETLEEFNDRIWQIYWEAREYWVLALKGLRFVALAGTSPINSELWHTNLTGVARDYRKRGLAQIVKAQSTQIAQVSGAKFVNTGNDSRNTAMLAVNCKIGFKHVGDRYWLELIL